MRCLRGFIAPDDGLHQQHERNECRHRLRRRREPAMAENLDSSASRAIEGAPVCRETAARAENGIREAKLISRYRRNVAVLRVGPWRVHHRAALLRRARRALSLRALFSESKVSPAPAKFSDGAAGSLSRPTRLASAASDIACNSWYAALERAGENMNRPAIYIILQYLLYI